jgi:hypothetical protein
VFLDSQMLVLVQRIVHLVNFHRDLVCPLMQ